MNDARVDLLETPAETNGPSHKTLGRLFLLALVTGFSGAMMPGPLLAVTIQQTAVQGMRAPILLVLGHAILEIILLAFLILGLRAAIERPGVRAAVGLLGGAALVYMGTGMVRAAWGISLDLAGASALALPWWKLLLAGIWVCLANPYFTGWWATIGAGQLAATAPRTRSEYLSFYLGHETADFAWYGLVGLLIVTGKRFLTDGVYRGLIVFCGVVLILLGLWFFVAAVHLLRKRIALNEKPAEG